MAESQVDWDYQWGQVVARAWADDAFKKRLLKDPAAVLKEYGLLVPSGIKLNVVENTEKVINLVVPLKPEPEELSEEELHRAAGGAHSRGCAACRRACERCAACEACVVSAACVACRRC